MWRRKRVQPESPVREGRAGEDPQPVLAPQIIRASKKVPAGTSSAAAPNQRRPRSDNISIVSGTKSFEKK
jgi:hypothetical protein